MFPVGEKDEILKSVRLDRLHWRVLDQKERDDRYGITLCFQLMMMGNRAHAEILQLGV
jgi:hypothetical protein